MHVEIRKKKSPAYYNMILDNPASVITWFLNYFSQKSRGLATYKCYSLGFRVISFVSVLQPFKLSRCYVETAIFNKMEKIMKILHDFIGEFSVTFSDSRKLCSL